MTDQSPVSPVTDEHDRQNADLEAIASRLDADKLSYCARAVRAAAAELRAARTRQAAVEALCREFAGWHVYEARDVGDCYLADSVTELIAAIRGAAVPTEGNPE